MKVGEIEQAMLEILPAQAAEAWDRTGMLVGDPQDTVRGVAVALDPTLDAIAYAVEHDANVLVTHHPLFLDAPTSVLPASPGADAVGSRIWQAVKAGVSVVSFHTALDANPRAARVLAEPLRLHHACGLLEELPGLPGFGYGRLFAGDSRTLGDFAHTCEQAFGRRARVWGDENAALRSICLWTGSAGESPLSCLEKDVDLLVCGEVKYHMALDACERGLSIIELGHDVSEQPHCRILVESLQQAGVPADKISLMELPVRWH